MTGWNHDCQLEERTITKDPKEKRIMLTSSSEVIAVLIFSHFEVGKSQRRREITTSKNHPESCR
jgi:hypothetical protein